MKTAPRQYKCRRCDRLLFEGAFIGVIVIRCKRCKREQTIREETPPTGIPRQGDGRTAAAA